MHSDIIVESAYAKGLRELADILDANEDFRSIVDSAHPTISIYPDTNEEAKACAKAIGAETSIRVSRDVSVWAYRKLHNLTVDVFCHEPLKPEDWSDETKREAQLELKRDVDARQELIYRLLETMMWNGIDTQQSKQLLEDLMEHFDITLKKPNEEEKVCD